MKELRELLQECIKSINEIYNVALVEELDTVKNKSSILFNQLNKLLPILAESGFQINILIIKQVEKIVDAIHIGDCITVMDIVGFEIKPILVDYLESIGE